MLRCARTAAAGAAAALLLSACGSSTGSTAAADSTSGSATPGMTMNGVNMAGMNMGAMDGDGMSATVDGYSLVKVSAPAKAGKAGTLTFVINGPTGQPQTDFTLTQTKLLHLYLVRQDLTGFQHIHPTLDMKTGLWTVPVTIAKPGPYHMVAEFEALKADGNFDDRILGSNFQVGGGPYTPTPYAPDFGKGSVGDYQVTMDPNAKLNGPDMHLKITKNGTDVKDIQPYLDSFAHITGFRTGDLKAVHIHPNEFPKKNDPNALGGPKLTLASLFAAPGKYRMFIEFQTAGQVNMVPVDVDVS